MLAYLCDGKQGARSTSFVPNPKITLQMDHTDGSRNRNKVLEDCIEKGNFYKLNFAVTTNQRLCT